MKKLEVACLVLMAGVGVLVGRLSDKGQPAPAAPSVRFDSMAMAYESYRQPLRLISADEVEAIHKAEDRARAEKNRATLDSLGVARYNREAR